jgi:hypothetical protein
MIAVPGATPVATPVVTPIVATVTSPLVHVPPVGEQLSVTDVPTHRLPAAPVIRPGNANTVTVTILRHPVGSV